MTNFTEGRLQAYERMMRETGKRERHAEETSSGKTFSAVPRKYPAAASQNTAVKP